MVYNIRRLLHRSLQFSLRTLLVFVTLLSIWLAHKVDQARRQKAVVDAVWAGGGEVQYFSDSDAPGDAPFRDLVSRAVGRDFFDSVEKVILQFRIRWTSIRPSPSVRGDGPFVNNRPMVHAPPMIDQLRELRGLDVANSDFDNNYLARLCALRKLAILDIGFTKVTDEGLAHLAAFPSP